MTTKFLFSFLCVTTLASATFAAPKKAVDPNAPKVNFTANINLKTGEDDRIANRATPCLGYVFKGDRGKSLAESAALNEAALTNRLFGLRLVRLSTWPDLKTLELMRRSGAKVVLTLTDANAPKVLNQIADAGFTDLIYGALANDEAIWTAALPILGKRFSKTILGHIIPAKISEGELGNLKNSLSKKIAFYYVDLESAAAKPYETLKTLGNRLTAAKEKTRKLWVELPAGIPSAKSAAATDQTLWKLHAILTSLNNSSVEKVFIDDDPATLPSMGLAMRYFGIAAHRGSNFVKRGEARTAEPAKSKDEAPDISLDLEDDTIGGEEIPELIIEPRVTAALAKAYAARGKTAAVSDVEWLAARSNAYIVFFIVNTREEAVGAKFEMKGYKAGAQPCMWELRLNKDGSYIRDCRELDQGNKAEWTVSPRSFQAVTLPIRKLNW